MFVFVLKPKRSRTSSLAGKTVGCVDSTMLEADAAAMKSIVRRLTTGTIGRRIWRGLAAEEGMDDPTDEELRRFDKNRKDKKVSNEDGPRRTIRTAGIARMKDGTTHTAYKAEHVVDLKTDSGVVGDDLLGRSQRQRDVGRRAVVQAQLNVIAAESPANIEEAVADKELSFGEATGGGERDVGHSHVHSRTEAAPSPAKWSDHTRAPSVTR